MRIGRQPKRPGGPSKAFLDRKAAEAEAAAQVAPATGDVRLYLDDERTAPAGWTLARTGEAFREQVVAHAGRLVAISLDWHLGSAVANGEEHARWLADMLRDDPAALPELGEVYIHTSDRDRAISMARTIEKAVHEDRADDLWVMVGPPDPAGTGRERR